MKKLLFIIVFFVSVAAHSQTVPVSLDFTTTTNPDTISYDKARIEVSQPFIISGASYVKIYVTQTKVMAADDVVSRTRILIAPASVTAVLSFDPTTMKMVVNKTALNAILSPYNIHVN